jgi:serine/threonine protein kinase/predicted GNAT family N-acyltransferase
MSQQPAVAEPPFQSDRYQLVKKLGAGGEGAIFLVETKGGKPEEKTKCIMKKRACPSLEDANVALREAIALSQYRSDFIVGYIDMYLEQDKRDTSCFYLFIIMEYCPQGDLSTMLRDAQTVGTRISAPLLQRWFEEICLGVKVIHDSRTIHRDLKSENIFLSESGGVKIGDFGLAYFTDSNRRTVRGVDGTWQYMAPEVLDKKPYDSKADIFSMGCIFLELARNLPWGRVSVGELACQNPATYPKQLQQLVSEVQNPDLADLLTSMLALDAADRPSVDQILRHRYFVGKGNVADRQIAQSMRRPSMVGGLVKSLHAAQKKDATNVLSLAFLNDPFVCWTLNAQPGKLTIDASHVFWDAVVDKALADRAHVVGWVRDGQLLGVMLGRAPDHSFISSPSVFKMISVGFSAAKGGYLSGLTRAMKTFKERQERRLELLRAPDGKSTRSHWYVGYVGVPPGMQNQGIGTEILGSVLRPAEADVLPVITEVYNDPAKQFLSKHGFKVVEEIVVDKDVKGAVMVFLPKACAPVPHPDLNKSPRGA